MKIAEPFICDECGVEKSRLAEWLIIEAVNYQIQIFVWSDDLAEGNQHACSIDCALKIVGVGLQKLIAHEVQERGKQNAAATSSERPERED